VAVVKERLSLCGIHSCSLGGDGGNIAMIMSY